jgi:hypothetical protein
MCESGEHTISLHPIYAHPAPLSTRYGHVVAASDAWGYCYHYSKKRHLCEDPLVDQTRGRVSTDRAQLLQFDFLGAPKIKRWFFAHPKNIFMKGFGGALERRFSFV